MLLSSKIFPIWHVYSCGRDKPDLEPADFSKLSFHLDGCQDCSTARYWVPRGTRVGVEEAKTEETGTVEPEPELEASVSVASCQPCRHCLPTCGQVSCHHLATPGPYQTSLDSLQELPLREQEGLTTRCYCQNRMRLPMILYVSG